MEVNGLVVTVLKKGSYFGEIGLLRNCRRTASIRALSETCYLFVLSKVRKGLSSGSRMNMYFSHMLGARIDPFSCFHFRKLRETP